MKRYNLTQVHQKGKTFYVLVADPRIIVKLLINYEAGAEQDTQRPWEEKRVRKCAICGRTIGADAHVDHIIPWQYVGDCLQDNYQALCETCNTRKGNSTYFELSMLLLSKHCEI